MDQYRDPDLFYEEYAWEELLNFSINYFDWKSFYPIQVIDLKHQEDHKILKSFTFLRNTELILVMVEHSF